MFPLRFLQGTYEVRGAGVAVLGIRRHRALDRGADVVASHGADQAAAAQVGDP